MQRKPAPGFPANSCAIRMPDSVPAEAGGLEDAEGDLQQRRRQQLINFAHSHWGFNNWSWAVTKQELDFVDFSGGKYCAGVVAFVSVTVRNLGISREDIGYATTVANQKGSAIFQARKCAVTNALRETLLSFGGDVGSELMELLESLKCEAKPQVPSEGQENNQNIPNKSTEPTMLEPKNAPVNKIIMRKDSSDSGSPREIPIAPSVKSPHKNTLPPAPVKYPSAAATVPIAKAQPIPANQVPPMPNKPSFPANQMPPKPQGPPPAAGVPQTHMRPNSNEPAPDWMHGMTDEELRAERKRRQKQAQEEFRIKQQHKNNAQHIDGDHANVDNLILATLDVTPATAGADSKRKLTSTSTLSSNKRKPSISTLDDNGT